MPRIDIRAYQILKAAEGSGKLMVGKPVAKKKIDYCTAYEIVQRNSLLKPGTMVYAYRIVEAEIADGKIMSAETAQGGDELTFDACVDFISKYKKFHAAPVKSKNDKTNFVDEPGVVEKWHGMIELEFEADSKLDSDEIYDQLYQMVQRMKTNRDRGLVMCEIPKGLTLVGVDTPEDAIFLPER